ACSRARAERWGEEIILLDKEMCRVVGYFEWKAGWWRAQVGRRPGLPTAVTRGLRAYAEYQASIFEGLRDRCACAWVPYLCRRARATPDW
ncbi:hypothetical protein C8Q80DRAFT_1067603, partial [Daedaleopsis nitida]